MKIEISLPYDHADDIWADADHETSLEDCREFIAQAIQLVRETYPKYEVVEYVGGFNVLVDPDDIGDITFQHEFDKVEKDVRDIVAGRFGYSDIIWGRVAEATE